MVFASDTGFYLLGNAKTGCEKGVLSVVKHPGLREERHMYQTGPISIYFDVWQETKRLCSGTQEYHRPLTKIPGRLPHSVRL